LGFVTETGQILDASKPRGIHCLEIGQSSSFKERLNAGFRFLEAEKLLKEGFLVKLSPRG